jgi:hypothetical protein
MTAADAIRESARLTRAGESPAAVFAPDCVVNGNPGGWLAERRGETFQDQLNTSDQHGYRYVLRDVLEDRGERALFDAVWSRGDDGGRGAAGLFFGIVQTRGGLIVQMDLFATEREAHEAFDQV